jgi:hypothetical protein
MAEEQPKEPVTYTPEELATISELTDFFKKAPGQVDLDAGEEGGDADGAGAPDETLNIEDSDDAPAVDAAPPKRPIADLSKFDDVLDLDMDNFDAPAAGDGAQGLPVDVPLDVPLAAGEGAEAVPAPDFGEMDFADDGAALPSADATFDAPDFALPETDTQPDAAPANDDLDFGFPDAGDAIAANESDAGLSGLDDGFDLPPATSEAPAADADDLGAGSDFDFGAPAAAPADDFGLPATDNFDFDAAPVAADAAGAAPDDFGGDFGLPAADADLPPADTFDLPGDPGADITTAPRPMRQATTLTLMLRLPMTSRRPPMTLVRPRPTSVTSPLRPATQDDAFNFETSAPSLDDLSPEVALGGAGAAALGAGSLSSDLSSLAAEESSTVDPATLRRVRDTLRSFAAPLRRRLSKALLDENMKPADSAELMRLLSEEASAHEIGAWLDSKAIAEAAEESETGDAAGPRIIMARPEYTDEGLARQERLIKLTRFGAIAAFVLITLVGGVYFSLLKPMFYRNAVAKGRDMIMQRGASAIPDAERQFEKALSYYDKDTYAYLQYADAYRYKGLYEEAFSKLLLKLSFPAGHLLHVRATKKYVQAQSFLVR